MNNKGTQPQIYVSILPQAPLPTQPSIQHWAEFHGLYSRSLLVIHFKYNSVYLTFPKSLPIPWEGPWDELRFSPLGILTHVDKKILLWTTSYHFQVVKDLSPVLITVVNIETERKQKVPKSQGNSLVELGQELSWSESQSSALPTGLHSFP